MTKKIKEIIAGNEFQLDDLVKDFLKEHYIEPSKILDRKDTKTDGNKYVARITYDDGR